MVAVATHPMLLRSPWYGSEEHTALHRYLDDDFITAFLEDLHADRLGASASRAWQEQDVVGTHRDFVTLRQPMHRAFYVLSCELGCDVVGQCVPVDPARVASAGLVVRRAPPGGGPLAWMVMDGVVKGWQTSVLNGSDPDLRRRGNRTRFAPEPARDPPYSGEEIHPLHAVCVCDAAGVNHTVLYGYLPLAGSAPLAVQRTADDARAHASGVLEELRWPFGSRGEHGWVAADGQLVVDRRPSLAFLELMRVLVGRYRVGLEPADPANADLEGFLDGLPYPHDADPAQPGGAPSFLDYVRESLGNDKLHDYLFAQGEGIALLPTSSRAGGGASLLIMADQAEALRWMLVNRYGATLEQSDHRVMLPRYSHGDGDVYVARPFARVRHDGCEHVVWGPETASFRVASPFDPELSPSVSIPMPRLSDLKRGLAKAEFRLPKCLAEKLNDVKASEGLVPDIKKDGESFGVQWIVSFSIPIVTICALILLMIVVSILDIVFRWLPYVIVRMPIFVRRPNE